MAQALRPRLRPFLAFRAAQAVPQVIPHYVRITHPNPLLNDWARLGDALLCCFVQLILTHTNSSHVFSSIPIPISLWQVFRTHSMVPRLPCLNTFHHLHH